MHSTPQHNTQYPLPPHLRLPSFIRMTEWIDRSIDPFAHHFFVKDPQGEETRSEPKTSLIQILCIWAAVDSLPVCSPWKNLTTTTSRLSDSTRSHYLYYQLVSLTQRRPGSPLSIPFSYLKKIRIPLPLPLLAVCPSTGICQSPPNFIRAKDPSFARKIHTVGVPWELS